MSNKYAQPFAEILFAKYPEWTQYAEPRSDEEAPLNVTVPSPNPRIDCGLHIVADDDITIGVKWFHSHFGGNGDYSLESAIHFIDCLVKEETVVLVYFAGDNWSGSRCVGLADPWPVPSHGMHRLVLSWSGDLDSEMQS